MKRTISVLLLILAPAVAGAAPLTVETEGGSVVGISVGATEQWRGIPYAPQPVRWQPPGPPPHFASPRSAAEFGAACMQFFWWEPNFEDQLHGSEDCLFLNVTRPAGTAPGARLPVMVHLHGGGNGYGEGEHDAAALVARGVIVVTLNYRLDLLGFLAHRALTAEQGGASGNYGLMDQIAALHWVQRNIGAFGGDRDNVTLFGFSAGSFDSLGLLVSPYAAGLFHKVALSAVVKYAVDGFKDLPHMETMGDEIAQIVGCDAAPDIPACLRALPARALFNASGGINMDTPVDGRIVPDSPARLLLEGRGDVPMLIGQGREEASWSLFRVWDTYPAGMNSGNWVEMSKDWVGVQASDGARDLYPLAVYGSYEQCNSALATDLIFSCPTRQVARLHSRTAPTWRYVFTHALANDPLGPELGAIHGTDDFFLWGFDREGVQYVPTADERRLSGDMARWFTNFARTGDPTAGAPAQWPRYDEASETMLRIDLTSAPFTGGHRNAECDVLDHDQLWPECGSRCRKDVAAFLPGWFFKRYLLIW